MSNPLLGKVDPKSWWELTFFPGRTSTRVYVGAVIDLEIDAVSFASPYPWRRSFGLV